MRASLAGLFVIVSVAFLRATDGIEKRQDVPPGEAAVALIYAQQLNHVVSQVSSQYVRPIEREELITAALHGLYEAARVRTPGALAADVKKAATDEERIDLIADHRAKLGDLEPLRGPNALRYSLLAMTRVLDPYTTLSSGEEWDQGDDEEQKERFGLEMGVTESRDGPWAITTVVPGGPAQKAGLRPGDRITHIDGIPIGKLSDPLLRLGSVTRGDGRSLPMDERPGGTVKLSPIRLTVFRVEANAPRQAALAPQVFSGETILGPMRRDDNTGDYFIDKKSKIAQVRISRLSHGSAGEFERVLIDLEKHGMRGLILDLRWCPGGFLREAVGISLLLAGKGKVATVESRVGGRVEHAGERLRAFTGFPLLVLVNGETSGGAELIAAALQDNKRAVVAGQRTLGKASVQVPVDVPIPGMKLKLTGGNFIRPSGRNLHRFPDSTPADDWGIRPEANLEFRISADLSWQLRHWWLLQTLRPGPANEVLPLDDPVADPQRQAALQVLLGMTK